jgi:hypothetical protein
MEVVDTEVAGMVVGVAAGFAAVGFADAVLVALATTAATILMTMARITVMKAATWSVGV